MPVFIFTKFARRKFRKLDTQSRQRITEKLKELKREDDRRSMTTINDRPPATHRLRVGNYRLILSRKDNENFIVIDVDHRSRIYR